MCAEHENHADSIMHNIIRLYLYRILQFSTTISVDITQSTIPIGIDRYRRIVVTPLYNIYVAASQ